MNTRTVQHLLDPDWIIAVQEALETYPTSVSLVVEPSVMGQYCAEQGMPCDPLAHGYTKLGDVELYCLAYRDTAALWAEMVDDANEHLQDTLDYEQDILDREFWRRGEY